MSDPFPRFLAALEARHRENLSFAEIRRALVALSSLYVERRGRLSAGKALDGAGKRAAFALYYGSLHFLLVRAVVEELGATRSAPRRILDVGCGTLVAGAAWAWGCTPKPYVVGVDKSGWVIDEARFTLKALGLRGEARRGDASSALLGRRGDAVVLAFTLNELEDTARQDLLGRLRPALASGTGLLVLEPLARRAVPWWNHWAEALATVGGRSDEWRFPVSLPGTLALLDRAAGLDHRHLTARSLWVPPRT